MQRELKWYCVRTQTKRERIAAGHLRELAEIEVFCPMMRYRKATRRGKVWWEEALFPGYVLVRFDIDEDRRNIEFCQGVRGLVKFGAKVPEVPDWFIDVMRHEWCATAQNEILTVRPKFEEGDEVELAHGPLQGLKGSIVQILPSADRVKVLLEFLGQKQTVNVDLFSILMPRRPMPE